MSLMKRGNIIQSLRAVTTGVLARALSVALDGQKPEVAVVAVATWAAAYAKALEATTTALVNIAQVTGRDFDANDILEHQTRRENS